MSSVTPVAPPTVLAIATVPAPASVQGAEGKPSPGAFSSWLRDAQARDAARAETRSAERKADARRAGDHLQAATNDGQARSNANATGDGRDPLADSDSAVAPAESSADRSDRAAATRTRRLAAGTRSGATHTTASDETRTPETDDEARAAKTRRPDTGDGMSAWVKEPRIAPPPGKGVGETRSVGSRSESATGTIATADSSPTDTTSLAEPDAHHHSNTDANTGANDVTGASAGRNLLLDAHAEPAGGAKASFADRLNAASEPVTGSASSATSTGTPLASLTAAAPNASPNTTATASPDTSAQSTIPVPVDSPDFAAALGTRLAVFAKDGVQQAALHLSPAETGPVAIRIALDGQAARVDFAADHAATRAAIEAGLPQLASALREAGFTLAGGGVSSGAGDAQGDGRSNEGRFGRAGGGRMTDRADGIAGHGPGIGAGVPGRTLRLQAGGVDLYA